MLTIPELREIAEQASEAVALDWALYGFSGDAPRISPAMVRIVAELLERRMPADPEEPRVYLSNVHDYAGSTNGATPALPVDDPPTWAVALVDHLASIRWCSCKAVR